MEITNINQLDLNKTYSYADYLLWQFEERIELIKGWIFKMAAPSRIHQTILYRIVGQFSLVFDENNCNVFFAPFDVRLTRQDTDNTLITTVVQPDLCVICDKNKLDKRGCIGAPDLVVEILSPGNSKKEMMEKFQVYEESGVLEYWIVQPEEKLILRFVLNEHGKYNGLKPLTEDEKINSAIFPQLSFDLFPIFKNLN